MDALTVDRAVPVRGTQIKKKVDLEIRPQTRSKTTREEGREEGARRETGGDSFAKPTSHRDRPMTPPAVQDRDRTSGSDGLCRWVVMHAFGRRMRIERNGRDSPPPLPPLKGKKIRRSLSFAHLTSPAAAGRRSGHYR